MTVEKWIIRALLLLDCLGLVGLAAYQVYLGKWAVQDDQPGPGIVDTAETPFQFWFLVAFATCIGALMLIGAIDA